MHPGRLLEEMLHVTLVCNLLNAIGGSPRFRRRTPAAAGPRLPDVPPHSDDAFIVDLRPFSSEALETSLRSQPAAPDAPPEPDKFHTIGQSYEAVLDVLEDNSPHLHECPRPQVDSNHYYGGGGEAFAITTTAKRKRPST